MPEARSGMRGDGEDCDLFLARAVIPKNPPRGGSFVLGVGLEYLLAARSHERAEFVGVEAGMAWIGFQQGQGFSHGLEPLRQTGIRLQRVEIRVRLVRKKQFEGHGSVDFVVGELGEAATRFDTAYGGLAQALLDGSQSRLVVEQPLLTCRYFRVGFQDDTPSLIRGCKKAADTTGQLAQGDAPFRIRADGD